MTPIRSFAEGEPVSIVAALNAALIATVNLIAYLGDWSDTATQLVNIAIAAWVVTISMIVRREVTPNANVALTKSDVELLEAASE
jgi:hypothetical protein